MIEIKKYKCGKCGTEFDTPEECDAHEQFCNYIPMITVEFFYCHGFLGDPSGWNVTVKHHMGKPGNKSGRISFAEEYYGYYDASIGDEQAIENVRKYIAEDIQDRISSARNPLGIRNE